VFVASTTNSEAKLLLAMRKHQQKARLQVDNQSTSHVRNWCFQLCDSDDHCWFLEQNTKKRAFSGTLLDCTVVFLEKYSVSHLLFCFLTSDMQKK
jgi:hypothetical protein